MKRTTRPTADPDNGLFQLDSLHDFTLALEHVMNQELARRMADVRRERDAAIERAEAAEGKLANYQAAADLLRGIDG